MINQEKVFRYYLKEFFTPVVSKQLMSELRPFNLSSNLLINTHGDFMTIKQIVTSLYTNTVPQTGFFEFSSTTFYGLINSYFQKENAGDLSTLINEHKYLIMYDLGEMGNKLLDEIVSYVLNLRLMDGKFNLLIFTERTPSDLVSRQVLDQFTKYDLRSMATVKKSDIF